jgi:hypothetical protein
MAAPRPSPSVSATGFAVGARLAGNDGRLWEVVAVRRGVHRWRRAALATTDRVSCTLHAVLPVVLDDRLGERSRWAGRGLSHATHVPADARVLLRRRILKNEFEFERVLSVLPTKLKKGFFGGKKNVPVTLTGFRLLERGPWWAIDLTWTLPVAAADVDEAACGRALSGSLSDGWGEGVEQFRFGPLVVCADDNDTACRLATSKESASLQLDLDGRYAFNLTTLGGSTTITTRISA